MNRLPLIALWGTSLLVADVPTSSALWLDGPVTLAGNDVTFAGQSQPTWDSLAAPLEAMDARLNAAWAPISQLKISPITQAAWRSWPTTRGRSATR